MFTLDYYFPRVKNSSRGLKYKVLDDVCPYADKVNLLCVDCGASVYTKPAEIFFGRIPCKCGSGYYRTPERRLERLKEKLAKTNFIINYENLPPLQSAIDTVPLMCGDCGFSWAPVLNSIICGTTGCQRCAGLERYSEDFYVDKINSLDNLKFISKVGDKLGSQEKVIVQCLKCQCTFTPLVSNLFQGKGCSACANYGYNPSVKGYLYIVSVKKDSKIIAYKFGITNNPDERVKKLQKRCAYYIKPLLLFSFSSGREAANIEALIKKSYGNYLSKEEMPDGFTETVCTTQIKNLINDIHKIVNHSEVV